MKRTIRLFSIFLASAASLFSMTAHSQTSAPIADRPAFPGVGHVWRADFGRMAFDIEFAADSLTYRAAKGAPAGEQETVPYTVTPLRDGQYAVRWLDKTGYVVHIEDFKQGTVHSLVTLRNGQPLEMQGTFTPVR